MDRLHHLLDKLHLWLAEILAWVEGFAATPYGTWALFGIAFAESSFFPVPPDVLLIALCLGAPEKALFFGLVCTAGSVLGGMLGYGIGYYGGRPFLKRFFDANKIAAVERYFDRYNAWATGIAGLTPLPYKIFTVSGGAFAVNFRIFVIASILARGLRFLVVAALIARFGEPITAFIDRYLPLLSILFIVILAFGYWFVARRMRAVANAEDVREEGESDSTSETL